VLILQSGDEENENHDILHQIQFGSSEKPTEFVITNSTILELPSRICRLDYNPNNKVVILESFEGRLYKSNVFIHYYYFLFLKKKNN